MKLKSIYLFFCMLLAFATVCVAQDDEEDRGSGKVTVRPNKFSMRAEIGVPTPLNSAWRKAMVGVYESNVTLNYRMAHDFFIGAGYKSSRFYTPPKFFIFDLKTKMQMHSGFLRLGYDIYKTNSYFITPMLNSGWMFTSYSNISCVKEQITWEPKYQSWFIEPQVNFNFLPDPSFGISVTLSYVLADHVWDPEFICLQDHIDFSDVKRNGITSYLNLGFGIYWGFGKGKTIAGK